MEKETINAVSISRPIWSTGFEDASWLFPDIERKTKIAIFGFSIEEKNFTRTAGAGKEDDIGRASRSIALYIMERLFIESDIEPAYYVLYINNIGCVVSSVRGEGKELSETLQNKYDYIITGAIERNHSNAKITIKIFIYEQKTGTEKIIIEHITERKSVEESCSEAANLLIDKMLVMPYCSKTNDLGSHYKRPKVSTAPYYLSGLGQLLTQTLAHNTIIPKESLWGEKNMLDWYRKLMEDDIGNNCARLMFLKGVIASIDYKGEAYLFYLNGLKTYINALKKINLDDPMVKLSPLLFKKINDKGSFDDICIMLKKNTNYMNWLNAVNSLPFNSLVSALTGEPDKNQDLDMLYIIMNESVKSTAVRPLFYKELLESRLYFLTVGEPPEKEEKMILNSDTNMSVRSFADGTIPVFSSAERILDNDSPLKQERSAYISLKGRELFLTCKGAKFVLNPWSDISKELLPGEISSILSENNQKSNSFKISEGTRILLGVPSKIPDSLVENIQKYCGINTDIKRIYLLLAVFPDKQEEYIMLFIEASGNINKIFDELRIVTLPYIKETGEILMSSCEGYDEMLAMHKPIYKKI